MPLDREEIALLKEYLTELHADPKMKKLIGVTANAMRSLQANSGELGRNILLAWAEKSGVRPDEEMVSFVTQAFPRLVKRHGFRKGPMVLLALLNDRYGSGRR